ncbi:hypothetical protein NCCP2716_06370 [Sporosarcina sp. NCCP-2716]|uniref:methylmalonyl-CoA mutase family protein n=1 Tax=Sporosarcina sp. NCCP-2716 TaxID=2943679 RepID=UPI00203BE63F|nr:methylmalonyl-CoA mutase family protein [Sporosarcina sp. NCCP-2716]GKV68139.1 hypothetical protein NCCP2716_06370 [Sporosarcina sp. NCCP-2716]
MTNSDIHTMKEQAFSRPSLEEWKQAAVHSLKGRPLETLRTDTPEGIQLDLLYTERPVKSPVRPQHTDWTIAQGSEGRIGRDWLEAVKDGLAKGNEAVFYDGGQPIDWDSGSLDDLAGLIAETPIAWFNLKGEDRILEVFNRIEQEKRMQVKGLCDAGSAELPEGFSSLRRIGIDTVPVHMEGADSVTELAFALTAAAERAEKTEDFEQFADRVFFRFAADTHFFMEIAKFRAFRSLWKLFCSAYGFSEPSSVPISAITSMRSFSKIDPHVNLLRAGNSAFSAVLGGADWLSVTPYNGLTGATQQSVRYARNMQLIIREETNAALTADPAGGSYFVELVTDQLIRLAWRRFLDMQKSGGTAAFLASGQLEQQAAQRKQEAATGELRLVGTNVYADPDSSAAPDLSGDTFPNRPAAPFEVLRKTAAEHATDCVLVVFGTQASYKARADFAAGFLAAGGLKPRISPEFGSGGKAAAWLSAEQPDYAILCAAPDKLEQVAGDLLKAKPAAVKVDIAGRVDDALAEEWDKLGLNGSIYAGQDRIAKLTEIVSFSKGGSSDEHV